MVSEMSSLLLQAGWGWVTIWKFVVVSALLLFGVMGVVVTIGAIRDLFSMLRDLRRDEPTNVD